MALHFRTQSLAHCGNAIGTSHSLTERNGALHRAIGRDYGVLVTKALFTIRTVLDALNYAFVTELFACQPRRARWTCFSETVPSIFISR